jgi:hypothetical protein
MTLVSEKQRSLDEFSQPFHFLSAAPPIYSSYPVAKNDVISGYKNDVWWVF